MTTSTFNLLVTPSATILSDAQRAERMTKLSFGRTFTDHMVVIPYRDGAWQVELFQNTPAAFHGRPELSEQMTEELRQALVEAS